MQKVESGDRRFKLDTEVVDDEVKFYHSCCHLRETIPP